MHGRMVQVISILVTPQSKLKGYQTDGLEQAPSLAEKKTVQPDYTVHLETALAKQQCL